MYEAYIPRFDGCQFYSGMQSLPPRDPMTSQFVSGNEADDTGGSDQFTPIDEIGPCHIHRDQWGAYGAWAAVDTETRFLEQPHDWELPESNDWEHEMHCYEYGTDYGDRESIEEWLIEQYGVIPHDEPPTDVKDRDKFEHLPHRQGRHWSFMAHGENQCFYDIDGKRLGQDTHGRHGRRHLKTRNRRGKPINLKQLRKSSRRQMDSIWLAEMTNAIPVTNEDWLDYYSETSSSSVRGVAVESGSTEYYRRLLKVCGIEEHFANQHWDGYPSLDDHNSETILYELDWYDEMCWQWDQYDHVDHEPQRFHDDVIVNGAPFPIKEDFTDRYEFGVLTDEDMDFLEGDDALPDGHFEQLSVAQFGGPRGWRAQYTSS